ncbi:MAG: MFS transporter [Cellulomonas sp.]|nr:MFS transporter [Cellulomonas sp.]
MGATVDHDLGADVPQLATESAPEQGVSEAPVPHASWLELPEVVAARRRTLKVLIAAQVLGSLGVGAAPSIGVLLAQEITRSESWAGVARASATIGAALLALPLGMLAARRGRRRSLSLAWSVASAGAALLVVAAATRSVTLLVVGMMALGAGSAAGLQSRFAATDLAAPARRARSLSLVVWVGTFGAVLGPNLGLPGKAVESRLGLPALSGAFAIGAVLLAITALTVWLLMRPDPLLVVASHAEVAPAGDPASSRVGVRHALREIRQVPAAWFALASLVLAHVGMVSVMTMTPVSLIKHGHTITIVGITISVHVLGMYAFAPLVGAATDRFGRVPVILVGQAVLGLSAVVNMMASGSTAAVVAGLFLLGLGWSIVTVPAAALLSQSVPAPSRPFVQGAGDSAMNAAAAIGAIASGPVMATIGFSGLAGIGGMLILPILWMARRQMRFTRHVPLDVTTP